jgi:hypothetical protein
LFGDAKYSCLLVRNYILDVLNINDPDNRAFLRTKLEGVKSMPLSQLHRLRLSCVFALSMIAGGHVPQCQAEGVFDKNGPGLPGSFPQLFQNVVTAIDVPTAPELRIPLGTAGYQKGKTSQGPTGSLDCGFYDLSGGGYGYKCLPEKNQAGKPAIH